MPTKRKFSTYYNNTKLKRYRTMKRKAQTTSDHSSTDAQSTNVNQDVQTPEYIEIAVPGPSTSTNPALLQSTLENDPMSCERLGNAMICDLHLEPDAPVRIKIEDIDSALPENHTHSSTQTEPNPVFSKMTLRKVYNGKLKNLQTWSSVEREWFVKYCGVFFKGKHEDLAKALLITLKPNRKNRIELTCCYLEIYYSGVPIYNLLKDILFLPPVITLKRSLICHDHMDEVKYKLLGTKAKYMTPVDKICILYVTSFKVNGQLAFDPLSDTVIGFVNTGMHNVSINATHVAVVMIRGVALNWKLPISYKFYSEDDVAFFENWLSIIVCNLTLIGFNVQALVTDPNSPFLESKLVAGIRTHQPFFNFPCGLTVCLLLDPVKFLIEFIKGFKKNNLSCNDYRVASWEVIRKTYIFNKQFIDCYSLIDKDSFEHVEPGPCDNVKKITDVLSKRTCGAINAFVEMKKLDPDALDTALFINQFTGFINVLGLNNLKEKSYTGSDIEREEVLEVLRFFSRWQFCTTKEIRYPYPEPLMLTAIRASLSSIIMLFNKLAEHSIASLCYDKISLSIMDEFFERVKKRNNYQTPSCYHVVKAFNRAFVFNLTKAPYKCAKVDSIDSVVKLVNRLKSIEISKIRQNPAEKASNLLQNERAVGMTRADYINYTIPEENALSNLCKHLMQRCVIKDKGCALIRQFVETPAKFETVKKFIAKLEDILWTDDRNFVCISVCDSMHALSLGVPLFERPCQCFPEEFLRRLYVRIKVTYLVNKVNATLLLEPGEFADVGDGILV